MENSELDAQLLEEYARQLRREEKSGVTVEKYLRDVWHFERWLNGREITKERIIDYKHVLLEDGYALRSVNSMLASVNTFCGSAD